jgi:mRNA-degrading endonuclease RelE of RelBE toxin-antitoxin system
LKDRVFGKISEIIENPEIRVPKKNELKGLRGVHVDPFVIVYVMIDDQIVFLNFDHHDHVYSSESLFRPAQMAELRMRFHGFDQT